MNPWFDPQSVHLTDPGSRGDGVSVFDVAGVRDPEVEYQKYYKAVMAGDETPKTLALLNYWAEVSGKTKFTRDINGKLVQVTPTPNMPPAWS